MRLRIAFVLIVALILATPAGAFAGPPGPLLQKAAAEDPLLAARLQRLEADARSRGVDAPAGASLTVLPDRTGAPALSVTPQAVTSGELRTLAILVDFSDHPSQVAGTFFDDMLFADLFGPASLRGYYREVSYGTASTRGVLDIVTLDAPSSLGWVRLPQTLEYYAGTDYGRGTYPNNSQKMVEDTIALVNPYIDFSQYDNDHDGYVDNVMVIHAGEGAEFNGPVANHIWSHAWATRSPILCDGVYVYQYSTEPEYWSTPGDMRPGVYAHELGHTLGLPDLYDRDRSSSGIGEWSLMASGSWNGISGYGDSPARLDAWSSARLGWLQPQTAVGYNARSLPSVGTSRSGSAWKVYPNGGTSGSEYWMVENRQMTGTDSAIPGSGLLVWHIDETKFSTQNDDETHKLVDLEEAAGEQSLDVKADRGTVDDPYPGSTVNRAFDGSSIPDSNRYSGAASQVIVDTISNNGPSMTARIGSSSQSMAIAGGAVYTASASVTVGSSVPNAVMMRVDTGSGFGAWVAYAASYPLTLPAGDGTKSVTMQYRNASLVTIATLSDSIILDTSAPSVSSLASSSHPVESTWYASNTVTFSWSSADALSGVAGYSYVLDSSPSTTPDTTQDSASSSLQLSSVVDGVRYFHVRARDNAGNWGPAAHRTVRIDKTPPSTTTSVKAIKYLDAVSIGFDTVDLASGVSVTHYTLDGGPESTYVAPIDVSELGVHTLTYHSHDVAGNIESTKQVVFSLVTSLDVSIVPVQGSDRFETAVKTSELGFDGGAETVLVATGRNWPDALGASSLAGALDAPILLVEKSSIPLPVAEEIARLGATKAIIIGGVGAVDDTVKSQLMLTGSIASVSRIAGTDRYDTARKVAAATISAMGSGYDGTLFVATGQNYADALAASPAAAANGWPTLLVPSGAPVPAATLSFAAANGDRAIILGGTNAVALEAWQGLWDLFGTSGVTRLGGTDRFDTAVKVADWSVANAGLSYAAAAIATGRSPYDALAGGVVQGSDGSVLLLTESTALPTPTAGAIEDNAAAIFEVRFLGGTGAVSQSVRDAVEALVTP